MCDCPNGWLFCSHTLAMFMFIHLVQSKTKWTYDEFKKVMPQPIKSLQNLPFSTSYIFNDLKGNLWDEDNHDSEQNQGQQYKSFAKRIGKGVAREMPGYSDVGNGIDDTDA